MRAISLVASALLIAACGRYNFEPASDGFDARAFSAEAPDGAGSADSAPSVATTSNGNTPPGGGNPLTFPHTVTATNHLLIAVAALNSGSSRFSGATYSGRPMIQLGATVQSADTQLYVYYLFDPPVGTANVVVTCENSSKSLAGVAFTLANVSAAGPIDLASHSPNVGTGMSSAVNVPSQRAGLIIDGIAIANNGPITTEDFTAAAGQTEIVRVLNNELTDSLRVGVSVKPSGATTTPMGWTLTGGLAFSQLGFGVNASGP